MVAIVAGLSNLVSTRMGEQPNNAEIERRTSLLGNDPRLRNAILTIIGLLITAQAVTIIWLVDDYWRNAAEWLGYAVVPKADPALANRKLKPQNIQAILGDPANYPDDARDRGEQGLTVATLVIAPTGKVSGCRVTRSSRSTSLDRATCRMAQGRLRFEPARDARGEAIASTYPLRVRWVLPPNPEGR